MQIVAVLSNFCRCFACALFACVLFVFGGTGVAWAYTVAYDCGYYTGTAPLNDTATDNTAFIPALTANDCNQMTGATLTGWAVSGTDDVKSPGVSFNWEYDEDKTFTAIWSCYPNVDNTACVQGYSIHLLNGPCISYSNFYPEYIYTIPTIGVYLDVARTKLMTSTDNPVQIPYKAPLTISYDTNAPYDPANPANRYTTTPSSVSGIASPYSCGTFVDPDVGISNLVLDNSGYITTSGNDMAKAYSKNKIWRPNGTSCGTSVYAPSLTLDGYTFDGWYDNLDGTGTDITLLGCAGGAYNVSGTLYAHWTPKKYKVVYNKGAHAAAGSVNYEDEYDTDTETGGAEYDSPYMPLAFDSAPISDSMSAESGYEFVGWTTDSTPTFTNGVLNNQYTGDTWWKRTSDLTLYAAYTCDSASGLFWSDVTNQCEPGYEITINNGNCFEWDVQPVPAVLYTIHGTGVYLDAARTQKMEPRVNGEGGQNPLQQVAQANYSIYYDTQTNIPTNPAGAAYVVPSLDPLGLTMVCNGGINSQALYIVQGYITQAGVDKAKIVTSNQTWGLSGCQCGGKNLASLSQIAIEGYTAGWYDNVEGNGNSMSYISCSGLGNSFYCSKEATVYAHWTPKNYTVTYDCDDGHIVGDTESTTTSNTATFDTPYTFLTGADTCEKAGFVFNQWECKKGNITIDQTTNAQYWKVNGAVTCTASYSSNTVNLQWRPNGGTLGTTMPNSCVYYTSGGISGISPNPTKTGYTFNGWRIANWDECGVTSIDWEHDETHFSAITWGSLGQYDMDSNFCWYDNSGAPGYCSSPIFSDLELYGWKVESASGTVYGESKCNNSYDDYDDVSEGSICWCKLVDYTPSGQPKCHLYTFAGHMHRSYDNRNYCISDCARSCGSGVKQHYIRVFE